MLANRTSTKGGSASSDWISEIELSSPAQNSDLRVRGPRVEQGVPRQVDPARPGHQCESRRPGGSGEN